MTCNLFRFTCNRRLLVSSRDLLHTSWKPPSTCRTCAQSSDRKPVHSNTGSGGQEDRTSQLVYEGSLTRTVRGVKLFSLSTSSLGLAIQVMVYLKMSHESQSASWVLVFGGSIATIVLMSPLLLHYMTKRYVTRVYFEPESRTFTTWSLTLFNRKRVTTFKAEDVVLPSVRSPFTTFTVAGRPFFIDPLSFKDIAIFEHLVGYDKLDDRLRAVAPDDEQNENRGPGGRGAERDPASETRGRSD